MSNEPLTATEIRRNIENPPPLPPAAQRRLDEMYDLFVAPLAVAMLDVLFGAPPSPPRS